MDVYTFGLLLGGIGLGGMAVGGLGHRGHHRGHARSGSHGHPTGAARAASSGARGTRGFSRGAIKGAHSSGAGALREAAWALMSPRTLFSILLGFGMTGLLLGSTLDGALRFATAVVGGGLFERVLVTPLWNFMLRFASRPALTLESCLADEATAVTAFDANGHGLIAVELDGQIVQLLGTLQDADRAAGIRVRAGGRVRIEDVDPARNRCSVSAL